MRLVSGLAPSMAAQGRGAIIAVVEGLEPGGEAEDPAGAAWRSGLKGWMGSIYEVGGGGTMVLLLYFATTTVL